MAWWLTGVDKNFNDYNFGTGFHLKKKKSFGFLLILLLKNQFNPKD
jgi:hypothetical protein